MPVLPDIVDGNLKILFCGYNAGSRSAQTGHYFSNPRHRFWATLHEVGLTPRVLEPEEDQTLPNYGLGLTDLMKNSVHGDNADPMERDRDVLGRLVLKHAPKVLAFLGKNPAIGYLHKDPGWGIFDITLGETLIAMVPDPSPANGHFDKLKHVWSKLASFAEL